MKKLSWLLLTVIIVSACGKKVGKPPTGSQVKLDPKTNQTTNLEGTWKSNCIGGPTGREKHELKITNDVMESVRITYAKDGCAGTATPSSAYFYFSVSPLPNSDSNGFDWQIHYVEADFYEMYKIDANKNLTMESEPLTLQKQ